jgi:hypothetical protein
MDAKLSIYSNGNVWYTSLNLFMLRDMDIYGLDIVHLRSIQG